MGLVIRVPLGLVLIMLPPMPVPMAVPLDQVSFPLFGQGSTALVDGRLPLRLLSLGGCTIHPAWRGEDMSAPTWRIYLNLDDGAEALVAGRRVPFAALHLYVVPAWLRWSARCRGEVRHGNAMVDLPSLSRDRVRETCRTVALIARPQDPLAQDWMQFLADLSTQTQAGPVLQARGHALVWTTLARYLEQLGAAGSELVPARRDRNLEDLCAWIDGNLDQPLPRGRIARLAGCSEAECARRFTTALGTAPGAWVRQRRVGLAAQLLRSTDLTLDEIASRSGFADRSRLSRNFTRLIGCGPGAYRRRGG